MPSNNSTLEFTFSWYLAIFEKTLSLMGRALCADGLAGCSSLCAAKSRKSFPGLVRSEPEKKQLVLKSFDKYTHL